MIEQAFYAVIVADTAISAVVGDRIHHMTRPENEAGSAVVYQRISTAPVTSLNGDSGLDAVRLQVSCWAATHADSMALAELVRAAVKAAPNLQATTAMLINDHDAATGNRRTVLDLNLWQ